MRALSRTHGAHIHTKNNNCLPPISGNEAHNLLLNCSRAEFCWLPGAPNWEQLFFWGENYYLRLVLSAVHERGSSRKTSGEESKAIAIYFPF
jgi:hypothetical protein